MRIQQLTSWFLKSLTIKVVQDLFLWLTNFGGRSLASATRKAPPTVIQTYLDSPPLRPSTCWPLAILSLIGPAAEHETGTQQVIRPVGWSAGGAPPSPGHWFIGQFHSSVRANGTGWMATDPMVTDWAYHRERAEQSLCLLRYCVTSPSQTLAQIMFSSYSSFFFCFLLFLASGLVSGLLVYSYFVHLPLHCLTSPLTTTHQYSLSTIYF